MTALDLAGWAGEVTDKNARLRTPRPNATEQTANEQEGR